MGSRRGERAHVCVYQIGGKTEREKEGEAKTFVGGKMSNSNGVKRLSSVKRVRGQVSGD